MSTPSPKDPMIDAFITRSTGISRRDVILNSQCAFDCSNQNFRFRDIISAKEYEISGLCQNCQDKMFGND